MEKIEFSFNERDRRCAVIMILINTNFEVDAENISKLTGVPIRTVQALMKQLMDTRDPTMIIDRKPKDIEDARKLRDKEFVEQVQDMVDKDPTISYRRMAEEWPSIWISWRR